MIKTFYLLIIQKGTQLPGHRIWPRIEAAWNHYAELKIPQAVSQVHSRQRANEGQEEDEDEDAKELYGGGLIMTCG